MVVSKVAEVIEMEWVLKMLPDASLDETLYIQVDYLSNQEFFVTMNSLDFDLFTCRS